MSIEQLNDELTKEMMEDNDREYWKNRANMLGVEYHQTIPLDKLKAKVQAKMAEQAPLPANSNAVYQGKLHPAIVSMQDRATQLVRFRIKVLDPSKLGWTGMLVSVGNANLAPIKRAIYFIDEPWHAERIIVDYLKGMKYAYRPSAYRDNLKGNFAEMNKPKYMPAFSIEELPPLTKEELEDLARQQAVNNTGQMED